MRFNLANPTGKHHYRRRRSPEWLAARAAERHRQEAERVAALSPHQRAIEEALASYSRSLASALYNEPAEDEPIRGFAAWLEKDT